MVLPEPLEAFRFDGRRYDPESGELRLRYSVCGGGTALCFEERFGFGTGTGRGVAPEAALDAAMDLLHWIAGVSYWKAACRGRVEFGGARPDARQAADLERVYRAGLAELAWRNGLGRRYWPDFSATAGPDAGQADAAGLPNRTLVTMGGGKDSLVALERVRRCGIEPETVQVGSSELIQRVAAEAGTRHRVVTRRMDPALGALNEAGAINGHVPITAINAAVLVVASLLWGFDSVVFANERSADVPTLTGPDGEPVNHQFAKSHDFERLLDRWVRGAIAPDLSVFSILRRDRELAVCREFAGLERYHAVFSSCNRNFHLDGARTARWCGACPKCRFVFLALAPFMDVESMVGIFGRDLLADGDQVPGFSELLAIDGHRPFECVGEPDEARAAVRLLADDPRWSGHPVARALNERLEGVAVPEPETLLAPGGPHCIPGRFAACG